MSSMTHIHREAQDRTPAPGRRPAVRVLILALALVGSECVSVGIVQHSVALAAEPHSLFSLADLGSTDSAPLPPHLSLPADFGRPGPLALDAERAPSQGGRGALVLRWLPPVLLVGTLAALQLAVEPPEDPRWSSHNAFDDGIRRGLRADTRSGRKAAGRASDALFVALGAGLVADWYWLRDEYPIVDSLRIDSTWVLADAVTVKSIKLAVARQRPFVPMCLGDPHYDPDCADTSRHNDSFFSGHASTSAAIAGILCARHLHRRDRRRTDAFVCASAASASLATGFLRIAADKHFATDVIAGWLSGALFGYVLPSRFNYTPGQEGALTWKAFSPLVEPGIVGVRYGFQF